MPSKILITGLPGVGKTTIVKHIAGLLRSAAAGFYTEEAREAGKRTGFDIVTLDGRRATLSRVNKKSRYRVGKYGVDVHSIEHVAVPALEDAIAQQKVIIIDEIGKMELFSQKFRESVTKAFNSPNPMLAVIMLKAHPFADCIKQRLDTKIIEVSSANRDSLSRQILKELDVTSRLGESGRHFLH